MNIISNNNNIISIIPNKKLSILNEITTDIYNKNLFHLKKKNINYKNKILLNSIASIVNGQVLEWETEKNIDNYIELIWRTTGTVMYLKDFLILIKEKKNFTNIEIILWLIYYLGQQLKFILNLGYCWFMLHPDNIIVICSEKLIFFNNADLLPLQNKEIIAINKPFLKNEVMYKFLAPELIQLNVIPGLIHYKSVYYSLGCLVKYILLSILPEYSILWNTYSNNNNIDNNNIDNNNIDNNNIIKKISKKLNIKKICILLDMMMNIDIKKRCIIFN